MYALSRLDQDPEEAGEAAKLGQATDTSPAILQLDMEHFKAQHKAALTQQMFEQNPNLQEYVRQHPIGADVSNDDWGQLDKISEILGRFFDYPGILAPSVVGAAIRAFAEAHGPGVGISSEQQQAIDRFSTSYPIASTFLQSMARTKLVRGATEGAFELERLFTGGFHGIMGAAEQWYINRTGDRVGAVKFAREMGVLAQISIPELGGGIGGIPHLAPREPLKITVPRPPFADEFAAAANKVGDAVQVAKPWIDAGQMPPARLHQVILQAAKEETRQQMKNLDEFFKEKEKSSTLARDPESFKRFMDIHTGDQTVGISAEAVAKLYGDKLPEPGDGKLGDVPGIEAQYARALSSGYDVHVPWKDLSTLDPEVYDVLHDGIRVHNDWHGITLDEAKEVKPVQLDPYEEEYGRPYARGEAKPAKPEAPPLLEPQEALAAAVGHKWESPEALAEARVPEWRVLKVTGGKDIAYYRPKEVWTEAEAGITDDLEEYMKKIAPQFKTEQLVGARQLKLGEDPVHGLYQGVVGGDPLIFYALHDAKGNFRLPEQLVGVIRHEALHYLRENGFFTPEEWKTLEEASDREGWIQKHKIDTRYEGSKAYLTEEAIAHEYEKWNLSPEATHITADVFQKIREAFLKIRDIIIKTLGWDPKVEDIFHQIETGKVGAREPSGVPETIARPAKAAKPEDPELERVFKNGRALGMKQDLLDKYIAAAKEQIKADAKFKRDAAEIEAGAKATQAWRDNEKRVREDVQAELLARPDIATDRFLRTGEMPDGTSVEKVKIDKSAVSSELRSKLPEEWFADRGISPDDLANVFRYQSGDQLIRSLVRLNEERKLNDLTPAGHLRGLIDREAENQLNQRFGVSAQDIIDRAKESVVAPTRMDMFHIEYQALAEKLGQKPISEGDLKKMAKEAFDSTSVSTHSSNKYLDTMGKEGEKISQALLEGRGQDAFLAKQRQVLLMHKARLAMKLEKDLKSFDFRARQWVNRAPPGRDPSGTRQEAQVWINTIMRDIGFQDSIPLQDLERRKELYSESDTLREYVERINKSSRPDPDTGVVIPRMPVSDILFSNNMHAAPFPT